MSVESAAQVQSFKEWLKTSFSVDLEVPLLAPCKSRALSLSASLCLFALFRIWGLRFAATSLVESGSSCPGGGEIALPQRCCGSCSREIPVSGMSKAGSR